MLVDVRGNIYEFIEQKNGVVYLQSVNDDSYLYVDYTDFLHSPEYSPVTVKEVGC